MLFSCEVKFSQMHRSTRVYESIWWDEDKKRERGGSPKEGGDAQKALVESIANRHTTVGHRPRVSLTDLDSLAFENATSFPVNKMLNHTAFHHL